MPTREKIAAEINRHKAIGQDDVRRKYLAALHKRTERDTVPAGLKLTTLPL